MIGCDGNLNSLVLGNRMLLSLYSWPSMMWIALLDALDNVGMRVSTLIECQQVALLSWESRQPDIRVESAIR